MSHLGNPLPLLELHLSVRILQIAEIQMQIGCSAELYQSIGLRKEDCQYVQGHVVLLLE